MAKFSMLAFDGLKGKRRGGKRKRASKAMEKVCGCKISSQKARGGGKQPVIVCTGSNMRKIVSRKDAVQLRGEGPFCTKMIKPFRKRSR